MSSLQPTLPLSMLPASLFATVKEVPQVSGFDRTLDLPCSRHSAYEAMARLIVQYLGSEERIPAELLEMLRNGDLYKEAVSEGWKRHLNEKGWVVPPVRVRWARNTEIGDTVAALSSILRNFHKQTLSKLVSMIVIEGHDFTSVMVIRLRFSPLEPSGAGAPQTSRKNDTLAYGYYVFDPDDHLKLPSWRDSTRFIFARDYIDVLSILQAAFWGPSQQFAGRTPSRGRARPQLFSTYCAFSPATTSGLHSPKMEGVSRLPGSSLSLSQSSTRETPRCVPNTIWTRSDAAPNPTQSSGCVEGEKGTASLSQPSMPTANQVGFRQSPTGNRKHDRGLHRSLACKVKFEGSVVFKQHTLTIEPPSLVQLGQLNDGRERGENRKTTLDLSWTSCSTTATAVETPVRVGADEDLQTSRVELSTVPRLVGLPSTTPLAHPTPFKISLGVDENRNTGANVHDILTRLDASGPSTQRNLMAGTPRDQESRVISGLVDLRSATIPTASTQARYSARYSREDKGKGKALDSGIDDIKRDQAIAVQMEILRDRARRLQSRVREDLTGAFYESGSPYDLTFLRARDGLVTKVASSARAVETAGSEETSASHSEQRQLATLSRPQPDPSSTISSPNFKLSNAAPVGEMSNIVNSGFDIPHKHKALSSLLTTKARFQSTEAETGAAPLQPSQLPVARDAEHWKRLGDRRMRNRRQREQPAPMIEVSPPSPTQSTQSEPLTARREPSPPPVPLKGAGVVEHGPSAPAHRNADATGTGDRSRPSSPYFNLLAPQFPDQARQGDDGPESETRAGAETRSEGLLAALAHCRIRRPRSLNFLRHHHSSSADADFDASSRESTSASATVGSRSRLWHRHAPHSTSSSLTQPSPRHAHRASDPGPLPPTPELLAPSLNGGSSNDRSLNFNPNLVEALLPGYSANSVGTLKECGICMSDMPQRDMALIPCCKHVFCYPCIQQYVSGRLQGGRLNMPCPSCTTEPARAPAERGEVSRDFIEYLALTTSERDTLERLEMAEFAVLHRCPKCVQSIYVDRQEYTSSTFIDCPLPECGGRSCKRCVKEVGKVDTNPHICGQDELASYMDSSGAKRCPGCTTPIERNQGCNHMTCIVPACNAHFCYRCTQLIVQSVDSAVVRDAVKAHYTTCKMFT